ncbi:hypothetical protein PI124_g2567 [Phytophthora idaei]|nr:hypothetical protein PI125_g5980 [Phytophthora idaei]KAG3164022.1 hypothetical protein PI126_g5246 [Phytophthora idaei]KAG3252869.1 hypothetical protein PI124_g2567 [Phytophthora idaei]
MSYAKMNQLDAESSADVIVIDGWNDEADADSQLED